MLFYHLLKIFIRHIHSCLMIPINVTPNVAKASSCSIGLDSSASIGLSSSTSCSSSVANTHSGVSLMVSLLAQVVRTVIKLLIRII
jgi:hypothetical protein